MINLLHPQETKRLEAVRSLGILDTPPDDRFDAITKGAIDGLHVPISTISIIDEDREWFKSCQGLPIKEGPREIAFCSYAMLANDMFVVEDTLLDERFKNNPYVTGAPFVRFYAGIALLDATSGLPVGVFCVKDTKPRKLGIDEIGLFMELAEKAEQLINEEKALHH